MVVHGLGGDAQALRDLAIPEPQRHQPDDLRFPGGQARGIGPGRRARSARDVANPQLPEPTAHARGRRTGPEPL
jgi:hypothetical protein